MLHALVCFSCPILFILARARPRDCAVLRVLVYSKSHEAVALSSTRQHLHPFTMYIQAFLIICSSLHLTQQDIFTALQPNSYTDIQQTRTI